ncbi:MAG TPA: hypothetical protein VMN57_02930 [Anaerolineales bacterium]|nr:hypothetical protein [Anaerolineales bacterium]
MLALTAAQLSLIEAPPTAKIWLEGPAGAGKTTAGVERLVRLLETGVPGDEILVLVPQRTLAIPYYDAIRFPGLVPGGVPEVQTIGGLARRMVELFWPLAAEAAGFKRPDKPPVFLNIETAQYHMARIVRPLLDRGYFEGVAIDRNRLFSQILDNLNKAAFVGFPHTEIGDRLSESWIDPGQQRRIYRDAQECAVLFRAACLEHNLLDFSLVLETFVRHLWGTPICDEYLADRCRHLVVDNVEEDTPVTHDILIDWLPAVESALVIFDREAGFRRFLGADPQSAKRLKNFCTDHVEFTDSHVSGEAVEGLRGSVALVMERDNRPARMYTGEGLYFAPRRYYPEMLGWVADTIRDLVDEEAVPPGEIVVLAPYLSDALRFSLMNRLGRLGIPVHSHRPSRSLREEPAAQCLLTLAAVAHPEWGQIPAPFDMAYALRQALSGLDLVRSQLLVESLYHPRTAEAALRPFADASAAVRDRVTYTLGERYDALRRWLEDYRPAGVDAPDIFFGRAFGELLSQPGFGLHHALESGRTAANLIDSAREFRQVVGPQQEAEGESTGRAFLATVRDGLLAGQFIRSWESQREDAVLVAPAYTFIMNNRPVDYQFWLNVSSSGWGERLYQPLTNPHVLSRNWVRGEPWGDEEDVRAGRESMFTLVNGLLRRCRKGVFLGLSELDEHGYEPKGPLLNVLQGVLRTAA